MYKEEAVAKQFLIVFKQYLSFIFSPVTVFTVNRKKQGRTAKYLHFAVRQIQLTFIKDN